MQGLSQDVHEGGCLAQEAQWRGVMSVLQIH